MVDVATKVDEFCFLWIPHWSTCMSKAEWASWGQVVVGLVAIYAASRAVRAAHNLAIGAKAAEQFDAELRLVEREHRYLKQIVRSLEPIATTLAETDALDVDGLAALRNLSMKLRNADYSSFEVIELTTTLNSFKEIAIRAVDALSRIEEVRRCGARASFVNERATIFSAAQELRGLAFQFDKWRATMIKGRYP